MKSGGADRPGDDQGGEWDAGLLDRVRESYNPPPTPPLDAMWGRIEQDRREVRGSGGSPRVARGKRASWWLGMTAALIVGVALGRASAQQARGAAPVGPNNVLSIGGSEGTPSARRATTTLPPCESRPGGPTQ
jgi:hypothetical protein